MSTSLIRSSHRNIRQFVVSITLVLFFSFTNVFAQQVTATLSGIVTDASGGVVPKAHVVATNNGTNASLAADSNDTGEYRINLLPVGTYTVE